MTSYATSTDLETFGLNARALQGVSDAAVLAAIAAASSIADGYLIARYPSPPLTGWPDALRYHVIGIAQYMIVSGHIGFNPDGSHEEIRNRYNDAIKYLTAISQGSVTLITAQTTPARGVGPSVVTSPKEDV